MNPATGKAPAKRSEARERLLATASDLFYAEGINSVGVDRIVSASNVTLATFYRHFPSKEDLVVSYLEGVHDSVAEQAKETDARAQGRERVAAIGAQIVADLGREGFRGCAMINAASEFEDPESPVRRVVANHRRWFHERLRAAFAEAGHPRPSNASRHFVLLRDGAITSGYLDSPTAAQRTFKRGVNGLLRSIEVDHMPEDRDEG